MDFLPFGPIVCWRRGNSGGGGDRGIRRLSFDGGLAASASYVDVRRVWRKEKGSDKGELWSSCGFQLHCEPEFGKSNVKSNCCSIFLLWFNGRLMNSWFVSISIGIHWPNYCLIVLMAISTVFQWMFNRVGQLALSLWEVFAFLQMVSSLAAHFPAGNSGNCGTAQRS